MAGMTVKIEEEDAEAVVHLIEMRLIGIGQTWKDEHAPNAELSSLMRASEAMGTKFEIAKSEGQEKFKIKRL